jgi:hypothetical protein
MTMMCVRCYLEGRRIPVGERVTKSPPFSFMMYEGESRCTDHIPTPDVVEAEVQRPTLVPDELPPLEIVREQIETHNKFVVEEGTVPKKTPAKRAPAKKTQQRKRTKS